MKIEPAPPLAEPLFSASLHPWGEFEPGAWRLSKTCVETFATPVSSNNITCTENRITLQNTSPRQLSLCVESVLNLAGKNVKMEPRTTNQGFHGLDPAEFNDFREHKAEELVVDGQPISCKVVQFDYQDKKNKKTVRMWVNKNRVPYIFRKESTVRELKDNRLEEFTVWEVVSLNRQVVIFGRIFSGYQVKVESRFPDRHLSSTILSSPQVPGGLVSRVSREKDTKGRTLQVATTELMDFGSTAEAHQNEIFRENPMRVAGTPVARPTVERGIAGGRAKTLQVTLNFSSEAASDLKLPGGVPESYEYLRFRDRLFKNRTKTHGLRTNSRKTQDEFHFAEEEITISGDSLKDLSVPGMVAVSRKEVPQPSETQGENSAIQVSIFAKTAPRLPAISRDNEDVRPRKSPLYRLRKKQNSHIRAAETCPQARDSVAMLDGADAGGYFADENTGFIDLSVSHDNTVSAPQDNSSSRPAWRRHWRAMLFGGQ